MQGVQDSVVQDKLIGMLFLFSPFFFFVFFFFFLVSIVAPTFCDGKFSDALSLKSAVALAKAHLNHGFQYSQCN